jgi:hypothetical protein
MEWTVVVCGDGSRQVDLLRREQRYLEVQVKPVGTLRDIPANTTWKQLIA